MRVVFDASILGRAQLLPVARSGIFRYADNLLQALVASKQCSLSLTSFGYSLDVAGIADYLDERDTLRDLGTLFNPAIQMIGHGLRRSLRASGEGHLGMATRSGFLRRAHQMGDGMLAAIQQNFPLALARKLSDFELFHTPFLHIPAALRSIPNLKRCVTVQDLNPIVYPEYFPPVVTRWSRKVMEGIVHDDWVITYSQYVKDDLCNRFGVNPGRVKVTPLAADSLLFRPCNDSARVDLIRQRYGIPDGPYILSLGSLSPHKNIRHMINCFAKLINQEHVPELNLVLAGTNGWMLESLKERITTLGDLAHRVIQTGFVQDEDQFALYAGAMAFVFPSVCEGFGLPPLEAMQCGTPVICARATSLPEVMGTAGMLVDPQDEDALCQSILDLYRRPDLREHFIARGLEQAGQFSWARCANDTIDLYRMALVAE